MRHRASRKAVPALVTLAIALTIAACSSDKVTGPPIENPATIRVQNELLGPVLFFFVRACGTTDWGEDLLPLDPIEGTIQPGDTHDFTVEAGCYDLQARHLESPEPGALIIKEELDVSLAPLAIHTWRLEDLPQGPG